MSIGAKSTESKAFVETSTALLPLTPRYDESQHSVYVDAVVGALAISRKLSWWQLVRWTTRLVDRVKLDFTHWWRSWRIPAPGEGIRNIALTGGYGVGKSSILQEVARKYRRKVVQVSLSTLSLEGSPRGVADSTAVGEKQLNPASTTKTNQIQKEIVKQLLYREEPARMPGSRFKRIGRFQFRRAVGIGVVTGVVLAVVFYLTGWTGDLAAIQPLGDLGLWLHAVLFGAGVLGAFAVLGLFHNRIQIRQVKVADADIALSADAVNYFDQYLDEIVYFFEVTKRDVVIFEDIDRFDDPRIFETLRALNTLLNGAGQLRQRQVRFVYAIKDSIFVKLGDSSGDAGKAKPKDADAKKQADLVAAEVERANRTKFFDLVIPVVPFITHRNARNLMDEVLKDVKGNIDPGLIDLAARHITDMRLIKNVRNEFVIFKGKVLKADDGGELKLNDNALFAMMLYKGTHLEDFEKIKSGSSKLDDVHAAYRAILGRSQRDFAVEAQQVRRQLADLNAADQRSQQLADALESYSQRIGRHLGIPATATPQYHLAGADRTEEIATPDFWQEFACGAHSLQVNFQDQRTGSLRGQMQVAKEDAVTILGAAVSSREAWDEANREDLTARLKSINQSREELAHSDWGYFYEHSELVDGDGKSLVEHAEALESPLARELVAAGFLGRDFTLYTSTYYAGRVSTNAQNFLMHNVDRNVMAPLFVLSADEVDAIILERGDSVLREHGMYNINVLDRLLAGPGAGESDEVAQERSRRAEILIANLAVYDTDEQRFLDIYVAAGVETAVLVRRLARRWAGVFEFITTRTELEPEVRVSLFDAALAGATGRIAYKVKDNGTKDFLEANLAALPALTATALSASEGTRLAQLLKRADVRVDRLSSLSETVRRSVIEASGFIVNRSNLELAIGAEDLSLDNIQERDPKVYQHVLDNLDPYLEDLRAGHDGAVTIASGDAAASILSTLAQKPKPLVARVLDLAAPDVQIAQIADVPQALWSALATRKRFPATFLNVAAYVNAIEGIDADLASVLAAAGAISGAREVADEDKVGLCTDILASDVLAEPELRVKLAESVGLQTWLPLSEVPDEGGRLLGLLVEADVIPDDPATFALALKQDWSTREFLISKSEAFADFMTPTEVPVADVAPLMASGLVPGAVKDAVLAHADDFVPTDHRAALTALAMHALAGNVPVKLPIALVSRMATAGVGASQVVRLLVPILEELPEAQLTSILTTMGGEYAKTASRNGKRPKLPNTPADVALANRLKMLGVANSVASSTKNITVNMKRS